MRKGHFPIQAQAAPRDKTPYTCPRCGVSLLGEAIPEHHRENFGGRTHFSRAIALVPRYKSRITGWQCPDCGAEWSMHEQITGERPENAGEQTADRVASKEEGGEHA